MKRCVVMFLFSKRREIAALTFLSRPISLLKLVINKSNSRGFNAEIKEGITKAHFGPKNSELDRVEAAQCLNTNYNKAFSFFTPLHFWIVWGRLKQRGSWAAGLRGRWFFGGSRAAVSFLCFKGLDFILLPL